MKKFMMTLTALFALAISADAMSYEKAREQALFLTDKMAYELNLSDDQYEAAYEINLDYLMSINSYDDLYGVYWRNRNLDLSYIMLDWQYSAFCAASYFYRPLYWHAGVWHFGIYARYPRRDYFYFGRPHFYISYRGGHSWRHNGGRSWYHGRTYGHVHRNGGHGMRDRFDRGDYHKNGNGNFHKGSNGNNHRDGRFGNGNRGVTPTGRPGNNRDNRKPDNNGSTQRPGNNGHGRFGNSVERNTGKNIGKHSGSRVTERESSTRSTATRGSNIRNERNFGTEKHVGSSSRNITRPAQTFTPQGRSVGSNRQGSTFNSGRSHATGAGNRGNNGGGHFGGRR